jgi:hypothetical protein
MVNKRTDGSETDTEATTEVSESDGDHDADNWTEKQIGFLAKRILSRVKARKKTEEVDAAACSVNFAQAAIGGAANNHDDTPDLTAGPIIRAHIGRNGYSLAGRANENFRTEKQIK